MYPVTIADFHIEDWDQTAVTLILNVKFYDSELFVIHFLGKILHPFKLTRVLALSSKGLDS